MANSYLNTQTGQPELKDYDSTESVYEALKRRRKKAMEKVVPQEVDYDPSNVPNPLK